ncbi:hypothetical protein [Leptolyngbya sp. FACHB-17]|nr:hypothetical protein [Leptolyngbya sp. FACHB-17]
MNGALLRVWSNSVERSQESAPLAGIREVEQFVWLEAVGLGLIL